MPEFPDEVIRAMLEASGASVADYILVGEEGKTVVCVVNHEGVVGAVADDDDDRARASVAYLTKMKAPRCTTFEEADALVRERGKKPNQPLQHNASTGSVSNFQSPARRAEQRTFGKSE